MVSRWLELLVKSIPLLGLLFLLEPIAVFLSDGDPQRE